MNDEGDLPPIWSPTEEERRRVREFRTSGRSGAAFEQYLQFGSGEEPSVVLDEFLFLGNYRNGSNLTILERFQIKHIINVSDMDVSDQFPPNRFDVVHIPMDDSSDTDIKQHFDRTNALLHAYHQKSERCLVHCAAGVSRSATIVLAYLMKYHHNTLKDAFEYLVEKRPQVGPNDGFMLQLIRYENELIKSREISAKSASGPAVSSNPIETLDEFAKNRGIQSK